MDFRKVVDDLVGGLNRIGRSLGISATTLALSAASGAHGSSLGDTPSDSRGELSSTENASLKHIADTYPCAAMTLFLIRRLAEGAGDGTYQFEGVPSAHALAFMLDQSDGSRFDKWNPAMLRSPYSTARFYVEVHWSLEKIDGARSLITTRAQLVDALGVLLRPPHTMNLRSRYSCPRADIACLTGTRHCREKAALQLASA